MANASPTAPDGKSPVYDWFNERLEIQAIADDISTKYVPPHVNIFYCLGGITLVCFLIQFATGFAMTFYYKPTVAEAYTSVQYLMSDVSFGWLIRLPGLPNRWLQAPPRAHLGHRCCDGRDHGLLRCHRLLTTLGSGWILGSEDR
jgi:hypothetical protein